MDDETIWKRTKFAAEIGEDDYNTEITLCGWVQYTRNLGKMAFVHLRDRTGIAQITALSKTMDRELFDLIVSVPRESAVCVRGIVKQSPQAKAGWEIIPYKVKIAGEAKTPLPLGVVDKVDADMDTRFDNRFLDLRKPQIQSIFMIRSTILDAVREVFLEEGFIEIQTPKIVATATEGGTALFEMKYFDRKAFLNQSPQLFKQTMMATGLDRVFEIGPAFRAEEHDTVRHLNEYTSIDCEMAWGTLDDSLDVLEKVIQRVYSNVLNHNFMQLESMGQTLVSPERPFPRLNYNCIIDKLSARGIEVVDENTGKKRVIEWGDDIPMDGFKEIAKDRPSLYFIMKWPMKLKPFYIQPDPDDPEVSQGFDLNYGEKELVSGGQRVHDPELLRKLIRERGMDPEDFGFYLKAFDYGMPPHAGWGLGVERLTMIITGSSNVRETVLFPRDKHRLVP
ncbi:MAG TPA: aspartate--tRNA(Asn) ligase [Euryarchaeota archaeon]|nr:MAG: aspartate--tRNA(Asn) ligase [Thermoplasmatales archaeon ex4484_6]RLF66523.1 MAG: aspartate--tRNA(Asn) ligase [Thermoplasmata archaeon]HHD16220.1 aspartate--tRNA(Asn) ligase [Euryarchaeota archaeon]